jgi:hypothetical protein
MKTHNMKITIPLLIAITLSAVLSCKKSDPTTEDIQNQISRKFQSSTWKVRNVQRDGVDVTSDYSGFMLNIGSGTYTTVNGSLAWPASGTWAFKSQSTTQVIRDGSIPVDFVFDDPNKSLTLTFTITQSTYTNGRTSALQGGYIFSLVP